MSTIQSPPGVPAFAPPPVAKSEPGDLYDASRWESAYREMHDVPALLIQLQDDLSRARKREALWMSLIVHLTLIIVIINADRFTNFLPKRAVILVSPQEQRDRELTYLEMPPDAQKVTKRPDTDIISDKDRTAVSKTRLDPKELKQILDSARAGRPGPPVPPQPQQRPQQSVPPAQMAQAQPAPQAEPPMEAMAKPPNVPPTTSQAPRIPPPTSAKPKVTFGSNSISAGTAIEQAARASLANRGSYGGDGGDYGLGQGRQASKAVGQLDVLSDTMGVEFGPYLNRVLHDVRQNWYNLIPEVARAPLMKKGKVSIEFAILKDGSVRGMTLAGTSGDTSLDRAAWGGITASNPFPPLPGEFRGEYLALRFHFYYNPESNDLN